jgi:hypothetical protein
MEWLVLIGSVASFVAGQGWQLYVQAKNRKWSNEDKERERECATEAKHADDLCAAYAEFVSAATMFLDRGVQFGGIESAIRDLQREETLVPETLQARSREALEDFLTASTMAEAKAITVIMREVVEARCERARRIGVEQIPLPIDDEQADLFSAAMRTRRNELATLVHELSGMFAPTTMRAKALATKQQLELEARRVAALESRREAGQLAPPTTASHDRND